MALEGGGVWSPAPKGKKPPKPAPHFPEGAGFIPAPPPNPVAQALAEHIAYQNSPVSIPGAPQVTGYAAPRRAAAQQQGGGIAAIINQMLFNYQSPLTGLGGVFARTARRNEVDPFLLPAIAGAETQFGTTGNAQEINNPFGWGPHIAFPDWKTAIRTVQRGLSEGYIRQGLTTVPQIQSKWAPMGASNDPTNLNSNWTRNVYKFYNELGQMKASGKRTPIPGLAQVFHDPRGSWVNGQIGGPIGGHGEHVHVGATDPRVILRAGRMAQRMGLRIGENPFWDPVDPVHTGQSARFGDFTGTGSPSHHYQMFPGEFRGRELGKAIDVSGGNAALLARYYDRILNRFAPGYIPGYTGPGTGSTAGTPGTYLPPADAAVLRDAPQQIADTNDAVLTAFAFPALTAASPLMSSPVAENVLSRMGTRKRGEGDEEETELEKLIRNLTRAR